MANNESNQDNFTESVFGSNILKETEANESHDKSLIIIGSKGVASIQATYFFLSLVQIGKTTMIHRFLEREDAAKPSIAMDYYYGRKAGKSLVKDVVHIWEIANLHTQIIGSAFTGASLSHLPHHITTIIMLDLSKPEVLWNYLEECLTNLSIALKESFTSGQIEELKELKADSLKKYAKEKNLDSIVHSFPLRLCIIGGRYDEFKEFEGVDKEFIGQALRAVAHVTGATLHYHSAKDSQLLRKTKELLGLYGFKGQCMKASVTDYKKPLYLAAGSDSLAAIDLKFLRDGSTAVTLGAIKEAYVTRFPQNWRKQETTFEDSANDPNFNEPIVDRLRLQREQEINVSLRDMIEAPATDVPVPEPL